MMLWGRTAIVRDKFDLPRVAANHEALSPLSFIKRTADVFPDRVAVVHGPCSATWAETYARCRRMASALAANARSAASPAA